MNRILDANINRACEAARVLEEIARFHLEDKNLSSDLKKIRHNICSTANISYDKLLKARDTENDTGTNIKNPSKRHGLDSVFKANIKRLQQSLRTLAEYSYSLEIDPWKFEELRYKSYTVEKIMWEKLSMNINKYRLTDKKLYLVTNSDKFENDDAFLDAVASALKGGVQILQLREKNSSAERIIKLGKKIRDLCTTFNALFIINDRVDIAQVVKADGVHLGQDDIDIQSARELLDSNMIIGISTHAPKQALTAQSQGADYIGVGPVFETPTKEGRKAVGLEYVKWACENIEIPFFAIGGIDSSNCNEVIENGAKRIAVVRAIINNKNPEKAAEDFIQKLN